MEFDQLVACFREWKSVRDIPNENRESFAEIANVIHDAGIDWYIADHDVCFGIRDLDSKNATIRLGRFWPNLQFSINVGSQRTSVIEKEYGDLLKSASSRHDGERFYFSIENFEKLLGTPDFLHSLKSLDHHFPRGGYWPIDYMIRAAYADFAGETNYFEKFSTDVDRASQDSSEKRLARLKNAPRVPRRVIVAVATYERNPDVVSEVRFQAKGICGQCGEAAPFLRKKDGSPFLEVHHRKMLSEGGEDTVENAIALCPNCHKKAHFG